MDKFWILLIALLIFLVFTFIFWKLTGHFAKKEHGTKILNHWPTRLAHWQAAILYGAGLTVITIFLLRWLKVLTF
jgi:divalent metal cation (Fe/Co/Zn/Cd) transporter